MENRSRLPALHPYLDPVKGPFYLKISLSAEDPAALEKTPFPFLVITDSSPLVRLIEAQWVTDAGSEVRRVFLLLQKDRYSLKRDELWPMTNRDIDETWQKAFTFYSGGKGDPSLMTLSSQIDERGALKPFQPLFYCKNRKLFFPPPCPKCGLPLEQCDDEGFLTRSGLQPYSTSLKRYLSCPACLSEGHPDFYVYELESDDPPQLKDRWTLIKEFGLLLERRNPIAQFPCVECKGRQDCYGSDHQAHSKIAPFSFHPFYMLIHGAASLNAMDFLALLSGASFEEIEGQLNARRESGRIRYLKGLQKNGLTKVPFLFDRDERYFLEVLYLKLSFLGQLIQIISSRGNVNGHPDVRLSIDRIWVDLRDHDSLLPFFWNFSVKLIDIGRDPLDPHPFPKLPTSSVLYFSGLVWFFTLLVNGRQNVSQVYLSFREEMKRSSPDERFPFDRLLKEGVNSTFLPQNIFWDPEGKVIESEWRSLWERSLYLGWVLLNESVQSKEDFCRQLEDLRGEVKDRLFQGEPKAERQPEAIQVEASAEDEAIRGILAKIMDRRRAGDEGGKEELKETVVLSARSSTQAKRVEEKKEEEEELKETVILSTRPLLKETSVKEDLPETVILSASQSGKGFGPPLEAEELRGGKKAVKEPSKDEFLAETVILGPRKAPEKKKDKTNE